VPAAPEVEPLALPRRNKAARIQNVKERGRRKPAFLPFFDYSGSVIVVRSSFLQGKKRFISSDLGRPF